MPTQTGNEFAIFPPSTFDRANGLDGQPGTPTPADAFFVNTSQGNAQGGYFFEEEPDSPEIERAEQGTIVHKFRCDPQTAFTLISTIGRGYTFEDSFGNTSRVVNSRMIYGKGGVCSIHITAESLNWDWPVDEFSLEITELNPAVEKHPRYLMLTYKDRINVHGSVQAEGIEFQGMYDGFLEAIKNDPNFDSTTNNIRYMEAKELGFKLHKGIDTFYLPGFRIIYSQYFSLPVPLNGGGYIQDPIAEGELPFYFWSTDNTTNPNSSMFNYLAEINPLIYANGISWLRLADTITYQRTWFRLTKTWQGAPLGHWDKELYSLPVAPYQTDENDGDFLKL